MIGGYYGYHSGRRRGGINVFVKKNIDVKVVPYFIFRVTARNWVYSHKYFYGGTSNINILAINRPPNQNMMNDLVKKLKNIFDRISNRRHMIVGVDLNINIGNLNGNSMDFVE